MNPETALRFTALDIHKTPLVAERGPDWQAACDDANNDAATIGRRVGVELAGSFNELGIQRSLEALAVEYPPMPRERAAAFITAGLLAYQDIAPLIRSRETR